MHLGFVSIFIKKIKIKKKSYTFQIKFRIFRRGVLQYLLLYIDRGNATEPTAAGGSP